MKKRNLLVLSLFLFVLSCRSNDTPNAPRAPSGETLNDFEKSFKNPSLSQLVSLAKSQEQALRASLRAPQHEGGGGGGGSKPEGFPYRLNNIEQQIENNQGLTVKRENLITTLQKIEAQLLFDEFPPVLETKNQENRTVFVSRIYKKTGSTESFLPFFFKQEKRFSLLSLNPEDTSPKAPADLRLFKAALKNKGISLDPLEYNNRKGLEQIFYDTLNDLNLSSFASNLQAPIFSRTTTAPLPLFN